MVTQDTRTQLLTKYRSLDFDDLCILTLVLEGYSFSNISKCICITPPAISHRMHKYREIWGDLFSVTKKTSERKLTEYGYSVCKKVKNILYLLMELPEDFRFGSIYD